jgi:hypothetical protein
MELEVRRRNSRYLGVGRKAESRTMNACLVLLIVVLTCRNANCEFSFDDIEFWVGSGENRAALAIDWEENTVNPPALVWGYRWDGTAHGGHMLTAVVAADPRLFAKLGGTRAKPAAVYGLGYDANGNGEFALNDGTPFDEQGFAFTSPADLAMPLDTADYYAEGWFTGFWHYGVAQANPCDGGAWSDTQVGLTERLLVDGAWDSWTFTPTFNFAAFAENPAAAHAPFAVSDFNRDGRVDSADYGVWRSGFGSTSVIAADANRNGIVDAADYVVWRKQYRAIETLSESTQLQNTPEPRSAALFSAALFVNPFVFRRNANRR